MAADDLTRWEAKYARRLMPQAAGLELPAWQPDTWLKAHRHRLPTTGTALDLACGLGHNSLYLASLGLYTVALDGSTRALQAAKQMAALEGLNINPVIADADYLPFSTAVFDVVVVIRFLNRALFSAIAELVRPNGLLLYKTFNRHHLTANPKFNPNYVLKDFELSRRFASFKSIASNEAPGCTDVESWLIARRPS